MLSVFVIITNLFVYGIKGYGMDSTFGVKQDWYAPGNGYQYKLTSQKFSYQRAKDECSGWGGSLAQFGIRDRFFYNKISQFTGKTTIWIGLDDISDEGKYKWNDGMSVELGWLRAWHFVDLTDRFNEDCVVIMNKPCINSPRRLDDVPCYSEYHGLCELSIGNPPGYITADIDGYMYALITSETMYDMGKRWCQAWGGRLAEKPIVDPTLAQMLVSSMFETSGRMHWRQMAMWVGLNDLGTEGNLILESGEVICADDINWSTSVNNQRLDCATFNPKNNGKIQLEPCHHKKIVLCEKESISNEHQFPESCLEEPKECQLNGFRAIDGTCHNLLNAERGRQSRPFKRMLPANYDDGAGIPRGGFPSHLPSPRAIVKAMNDSTEPSSLNNTNQLPLWGQLLAHDLTKLGELKNKRGEIALNCPCGKEHPDCFNIPIPEGDPVKEQKECYSFVRAEQVLDLNCKSETRQQENRVTSYIDASNVYGSTDFFLNNLREGDEGQLKIGNYTKSHYHHLLPAGNQVPDHLESQFECEALHFDFTQLPCFAAGDIRANEQAALSTGHITWLRKHNQIAAELKQLNPHWNGDKVFEVSRHIIASMHQQVTYNEFLPNMLGKKVMEQFGLALTKKGYWYGYDSNYDSTIDVSFATAAFRLGHTLINALFSRPNPDYSSNPEAPDIDLRSQFFDPTSLLKVHGTGSVLRGMISDHAMKYDTQFPEALVNHLFARAGEFGKDLPSINIQRGRDHGIPSYMEHRRFCGLSTSTSFDDMQDIPEKNRKNLQSVYSHPEDIDLFAGGISELPQDASFGIPGPTFSCLLAYQFRDLKRGDRYWFENGGTETQFTYSQLQAIKSVSLARIICDVGENVTMIQPRVMEQHTQLGNDRVPCSSLPPLDLASFQETRDSNVKTVSNQGNQDDDNKWTVWFPITHYKGNDLPLKPAPAVLRYLRVYRSEAVCTNVLDTEFRKVNGYYQIRFKCPPGTIKETDYPYADSEEVYWTRWSDQTVPHFPFYDENESLSGSGACMYPVAIQAQTTDGVPALETGDVFEMFSPLHGLMCKGIHQQSLRCNNYRIRFLCLQG